ncbi:MAG: hypothetical protein IE926_09255 [Micrococcales bacterium]|uniref:hypothetical protein n=1 Tax=Phycicoccus sp. TaxID=1902410 RepID=UPI0019C66FED|nr:hypothetical protein [Phycicoccus sp.]MBD3783125.1 hypothetical protein [Micrococcales bacterium]HMM94629.1 hypothetical protein [Phycicoccus sp.]
MQRFAWAPWGLLLVVLDLRVGLWDVLPDVVGFAWLVVALTGAERVGRPFVLARSAAMVGVPAALVTGTPLLAVSRPLLVAALVVQAAAFAVALWALASGVLEHSDDEAARRWAARLRPAAAALGVLLVLTDPAVYLVTSASALAVPVSLLWLLARLAEAVVGVLVVVLLQRVARSGELRPA